MVKLVYPIIAYSEDGFNLAAQTEQDFTEIAYDEDIKKWAKIYIIDSEGNFYKCERVFIKWPRTKFGRFFCKLINHAFYLDLELKGYKKQGIVATKEIVKKQYGEYISPELLHDANSYKDIIKLCQ